MFPKLDKPCKRLITDKKIEPNKLSPLQTPVQFSMAQTYSKLTYALLFNVLTKWRLDSSYMKLIVTSLFIYRNILVIVHHTISHLHSIRHKYPILPYHG